ncbi:MAG TPA: PAS domain-containing protein, partial [Steroidobacteraceae bacterium]|nr:PAS domain-containing protein [Steroidobacteraceae bacterium]
MRLVDAFVNTYSGIRSKLTPDAPVPATFRAHAIDQFTRQQGVDDDFRLSSVGRQGRQIATPPPDAETAATIEAFAARPDPRPQSALVAVDGTLRFRTVYPTLAREQSCVDCHNKLQPGGQWHLNDVMGAFVVDVPIAPFLRTATTESVTLGLGVFLALGAVGLAISLAHGRQTAQREAAASELARTRTFLHTIIENMPAVITVKDATEQRYVLVNRTAEAMFGLPRERMIGRRIHDLVRKDQADAFHASDLETLQSRRLSEVEQQM